MIKDRIVKANENIAIKSTKWFGSMAMFWACFIWAILPLFPALSGAKDFILYVSAGIIQLVALPLILVGSNVLNRASEARAEEDHKVLLEQFQSVKLLQDEVRKELDELSDVVSDIKEIKAILQLQGLKSSPNNLGIS